MARRRRPHGKNAPRIQVTQVAPRDAQHAGRAGAGEAPLATQLVEIDQEWGRLLREAS